MADDVFPCGHPMSSENTYTAPTDQEPRCRTCWQGHLWVTSAAKLKREVREAYASTPVTVEELAEMYGVTEFRIRRVLGMEEGAP